jgi:ketosteroid isomerase-like protein
MSETSIRRAVAAFYQACAARDVERIAAMLDDDVDWLVQGPVDVFSFFGQRRGKAAVLDSFREFARQLEVTGLGLEALLVDGDRAAAMIRLTSIVRATGRVMSVRASQFSRLQDGKIVEMRGVADSFDMVEQAIGRPLDLPSPEELVSAA